jgi:hypothetical protein
MAQVKVYRFIMFDTDKQQNVSSKRHATLDRIKNLVGKSKHPPEPIMDSEIEIDDGQLDENDFFHSIK